VRTPAWLGVDVGTSSLKVVVVGVDGTSVAEQETAWALDRPDPQMVEAEPRAWIQAVDDLLVPMSEAYDVRAVGVTGQMHGTILVDETGAPVRPAVLWPDSRAETMRPLWDALPGDVLARLGNPWSAGMTGPVLAWLAEHEPDALARSERVALPKDLVREHLVPGSASTDPSDASGTLLWDVANGCWSREATALVPARLLPKIRPSAEFVGRWRGAEVVVGGGDTPVSLVTLEQAVGGWQPGDVVVNLGSGAQVIDPRTGPPTGSGWSDVHVYQGVLGEHYAMVAAQNAGLALSWAQQQLDITWNELSVTCQQAPAGAGGVLFSPFVGPERGALSPVRSGPGWITGQTSGQPPKALAARASAEAQAFLVRRSWELLNVDARRVFLLGGGARDSWVRQLLADVLGRSVDHLPMRSASAAGAVILAGGPALRDGRPPSATAEPRELPDLADAYQRWRSAMYG
jgi:xylulokinase